MIFDRLTWIGFMIVAAGWALLLSAPALNEAAAHLSGRAPEAAPLVNVPAIAQSAILSGFGVSIIGALQTGFGALDRFFAAVLARSGQARAQTSPSSAAYPAAQSPAPAANYRAAPPAAPAARAIARQQPAQPRRSSSAAGSRTAPMFCSSTAASRSRRCSGGASFLRCRGRRNLSRKRAARQPNGLWLSREVLTCSISAGRPCQRAPKTRPRAHQRTPLREAGAFCSAPPWQGSVSEGRSGRRDLGACKGGPSYRPDGRSWAGRHGSRRRGRFSEFRGFMIARDNSHPLFGGIEHLMIFAQPIGAAGSHRRLLLEEASARPDDDATGSIASPSPQRAGAERATPARSAGAEDYDQPEPPGRPAKGYVLRFTRKGAIVVEGPKGSFAAVPGVVLPDRGRILSIENRNGRWVVLTENGVVTEPAP